MQKYKEELILNKIKKSYIMPDGKNRIEVLKEINLSLKKGDSISITGPSGSGKSTLLNLIGGLDAPDSGDIILDSVNLKKIKGKELSKFRNKKIGFIFQLHHLLPQCTVLENVLLPTLVYPEHDKNYYYEKAIDLLEKVGLKKRLAHKPSELSVGECQRTAVARALIKDPEILLADEPTGSLDAENSNQIAMLIKKINKEKNITTIIATHSDKVAGFMQYKYKLENGYLKKYKGRK